MGIKNDMIDNFITNICSHIQLKDVHKQVRLELISHIEEETNELKDAGMSEDESLEKTIANMGDPHTIGREFNKAHHGKPEWSILIISILFSILGIVLLYLIQANSVSKHLDSSNLNKSIAALIFGILIIALFYKFNYKKLEKYSIQIFVSILLINIVFIQINSRIPYMPQIGLTSITPVLLAISLCGIFSHDLRNRKNSLLFTIILFLIPIFIFKIQATMSSTIIYAIVFCILAYSSGLKKSHILAPVLCSIAMTIFFIANNPYVLHRVLTFLNPGSDPNNSGYIYIRLKELIVSSGFLGNGFSLTQNTIPEVHTDFIFAYIVHSFGWIGASILVIIIAVFIIHLYKAALEVKDTYGKLIIIGITAIFAIEFIWNILMILGFAPIAGISLPFISFGVSSLLTNMISIGIITSVYKRKTVESVCGDQMKILP